MVAFSAILCLKGLESIVVMFLFLCLESPVLLEFVFSLYLMLVELNEKGKLIS